VRSSRSQSTASSSTPSDAVLACSEPTYRPPADRHTLTPSVNRSGVMTRSNIGPRRSAGRMSHTRSGRPESRTAGNSGSSWKSDSIAARASAT
jgi:hypothetical protein